MTQGGVPTDSSSHPQAQGCTGLTARWCPIHGDCICGKFFRDGGGNDAPRDAESDMDDPMCPLHSVGRNR